MYRHCIYCSADLGTNDAVEAFPVGRTVAVDAEKGRLWAVCAKCARWNLAPIETRWEAVEAAERLFADATQRVQGENVGLAKLRDGTRLVRVGRAERREVAAWRYGRELRRWHPGRRAAGVAGMTGVLGMAAIAAPVVGLVAIWTQMAWRLGRVGVLALQDRQVVSRLPPAPGNAGPRVIRRMDLANAWVKHDGSGVALTLPAAAERRRPLELRGDEARQVVERALVLVNRARARPALVDAAVGGLEREGGGDAFLRATLGRGRVLVPGLDLVASLIPHPAEEEARTLPARDLLALEMALHEETERRAMQGELVLLERAWREAEEIAAIADRLATEPADPEHRG